MVVFISLIFFILNTFDSFQHQADFGTLLITTLITNQLKPFWKLTHSRGVSLSVYHSKCYKVE